MSDFVETAANVLDKLFSNFTWSRLTFLLFLLAFTGAVLYGYELYTGHFALSRLESEIRAFGELAKLAATIHSTTASAELERGYDLLLASLNAQLSGDSLRLGVFPDWASNAIYAVVPWLLLGLLALILSPEKIDRSKVFLGLSVIALGSSVVAANLPVYTHTWINRWGYPWGALIAFIGVVLVWQRRKDRSGSDQR